MKFDKKIPNKDGKDSLIYVEKIKDLEAQIQFREQQTSASRLCEYITGLKIGDPALLGRLIEDQKIIRGKYGLPDRDIAYSDLSKHKETLYNIAKINNMRICDITDCGILSLNRWDKYGVCFKRDGTTTVAINSDNLERNNEAFSLAILEHEIIHALQGDRMPKEQKEYEATIAITPIIFMEQALDKGIEYLFECVIKRSLVQPFIWDNADYFLSKIDRIKLEYIKAYRTKAHKNIKEITH